PVRSARGDHRRAAGAGLRPGPPVTGTVEPPAGAPDALPRRPVPLCVVVGVVLLEALALLGSAVAFLVMSGTGGELGTSLMALAAMFAILGLGMLAVARSLWLLHRWARP